MPRAPKAQKRNFKTNIFWGAQKKRFRGEKTVLALCHIESIVSSCIHRFGNCKERIDFHHFAISLLIQDLKDLNVTGESRSENERDEFLREIAEKRLNLFDPEPEFNGFKGRKWYQFDPKQVEVRIVDYNDMAQT